MPENYYDKFRAGDKLAASRLMSRVERGGPEAEAVLTACFPTWGGRTGWASPGEQGRAKAR